MSSTELAELIEPGVPVSLKTCPEDKLNTLSTGLPPPDGPDGTQRYLKQK